jgi:hypothetical protein
VQSAPNCMLSCQCIGNNPAKPVTMVRGFTGGETSSVRWIA